LIEIDVMYYNVPLKKLYHILASFVGNCKTYGGRR